MNVTGRVALGLDEFMLRLGHLACLLPVLNSANGNRSRIVRELGKVIFRPTSVAPAQAALVGEYLLKKRLAQADADTNTRQKKLRYPSIVVSRAADNSLVLRQINNNEPTVWWQDWCLAQPEVESKVGAITAASKDTTSKTGISHVIDWAAAIGIANKRLTLTATGRTLLGMLPTPTHPMVNNPYALGGERLGFAWHLFDTDGDVLAPLLAMVLQAGVLDKAGAVEVVSKLASTLLADSRATNSRLTPSTVRVIRDFALEVGVEGRSRGRGSGWHRISSRLESLVDIGLISKHDSTGHARPYEYVYSPNPATQRAVTSFQKYADIGIWAASELSGLIGTTLDKVHSLEGSIEEVLLAALHKSLGPTGVHIRSFCLAAASLALAQGLPLELGQARDRLVLLAAAEPPLVRLSRGYSGSEAEFASPNLSAIAALGAAAFRA